MFFCDLICWSFIEGFNPPDYLKLVWFHFGVVEISIHDCCVTPREQDLENGSEIWCINGSVRLASPGRPCAAHPGEPLTRANRTITLALMWWHHAPRARPKWPVPQARHLGVTQVSPWYGAKAIWTYRGQTGVDPEKLIESTLCMTVFLLFTNEVVRQSRELQSLHLSCVVLINL